MYDNTARKESYEKIWQQNKENALAEHTTGAENALSLLKTKANKDSYDLAYLSKQHEIWDTFGKQLEYDARTAAKERKLQQDTYNRHLIDNNVRYNLNLYSPNLSQDAIDLWNDVNLGNIDYTSLTKEQEKLYQQASKAYQAAVWNELGKHFYKQSFYKPSSQWTPNILKEGGTVKERIADAERLFKTIKSDLDRNEKKLDRLFKKLYTLKNK